MLNLNENEKQTMRKVIETIIYSDGLFAGNYDVENGSSDFMYGILSLLEYLAYSVDADLGNEVEDIFAENMLKIEKTLDKPNEIWYNKYVIKREKR